MSTERQALLDLIFPNNDFPSISNNDDVDKYINKLGNLKLDELSREPTHLLDEHNAIVQQTQELAVSNYKTFIETGDSCRQLFSNFNDLDSRLDVLLTNHVPEFDEECQKFTTATCGIGNLRKLTSLTLTKNSQLVEILELPQLMRSLIDNNLYEDALELAAYVRKTHSKFADIPILGQIVDEVEQQRCLMLNRLLNQLRGDITLAQCLQIVAHLRRMEIFNERELRLKFLQTRQTFLQSCLRNIPKDNLNQHLSKTIDLTRVNLFNIITQYRAIFNDDEHSPLVADSATNSAAQMNHILFYNWIQNRISDFLSSLESDLSALAATSIVDESTIIEQSMYFGLSLSKVGCDFRPLLVPLFTRFIASRFVSNVREAGNGFAANMERFTLINRHYAARASREDNAQSGDLLPPNSLLEFYPLADYLNNILKALNSLRLCAPLALIETVVTQLEQSLKEVANALLVLHNQEQQAFTSQTKDCFTRLVMCFVDDLVPYVQKCIQIIYPPGFVATRLGVNVQYLQESAAAGPFLDRGKIVASIQHLLPEKVQAFNDAEDVKTEKGSLESKSSD